MRSLQSIARGQEEARYISRSWGTADSGYVYKDKPCTDFPSVEEEYGSQENKDRWYALEVRTVDRFNSKLFTPDIAHEANRGYTKSIGAAQHQWGHFTLKSNPEDFLQYIDRSKFTVEYKGELV